ncbi:MAG: hypothetical protein ISP49_20540 [Reyranella sp.]|nr:hypothetical protein [Reyranella sp.]
MATFVTNKAVFLFEKPSPTSTNLGTIARETTLKGKLRNEDGFIETTDPVKVKKADGSFDTATGFLMFLDFARQGLDDPMPMSPADAGIFCALATDAAREASTDRDYLLAAAYALSGDLQNVGTAATKAGPFRYSESQWKEATETGAAKALDLTLEDRLRWYLQPRVAAFLTADQAKKFKDTFAKPPKFNELYFVQLFGDGATKILKETLNDALSAAIDAAGLDAELAAELKAAPLTVASVLAKLQARLEKAYSEARKVIDLQPDDIRLFRGDGDVPFAGPSGDPVLAGGAGGGAVDPTALANAPVSIKKTLPMAQRAFLRLSAAKWTPAQACGILANVQAESSFDFKNTTGDGGHAHGLCQWHEDRRSIFDKNFPRPFAQSTFEDQVDFITFEMNHNEKAAGDILKKDTTPAGAATTVCANYERPADKQGESAKRKPLAEAYALVFK